jgi:hypothetical protein
MAGYASPNRANIRFTRRLVALAMVLFRYHSVVYLDWISSVEANTYIPPAIHTLVGAGDRLIIALPRPVFGAVGTIGVG